MLRTDGSGKQGALLLQQGVAAMLSIVRSKVMHLSASAGVCFRYAYIDSRVARLYSWLWDVSR